jgi:transcriptional regulator with XRE-family HTH domain
MEQIPFHIHISNICNSNGQVPEQVIKRSGIERTYGHQLFNGTRNPSRDKVIQLAFGLELDVDGTQNLLKAAHMNSLYPKIKRDAVILYCIENKKDFFETQSALQTLDLTLLGGKKNG